MTPTTSLSMEGFLRGMQGNIGALIGSMIAIAVVLLIVRWFMARSLESDELPTARRWANRFAGLVAIVAIIGFVVNAAWFTTNIISRSSLDRSSVNEQMNSNIQPQKR